jgi:hypothetical protein
MATDGDQPRINYIRSVGISPTAWETYGYPSKIMSAMMRYDEQFVLCASSDIYKRALECRPIRSIRHDENSCNSHDSSSA